MIAVRPLEAAPSFHGGHLRWRSRDHEAFLAGPLELPPGPDDPAGGRALDLRSVETLARLAWESAGAGREARVYLYSFFEVLDEVVEVEREHGLVPRIREGSCGTGTRAEMEVPALPAFTALVHHLWRECERFDAVLGLEPGARARYDPWHEPHFWQRRRPLARGRAFFALSGFPHTALLVLPHRGEGEPGWEAEITRASGPTS